MLKTGEWVRAAQRACMRRLLQQLGRRLGNLLRALLEHFYRVVLFSEASLHSRDRLHSHSPGTAWHLPFDVSYGV